MAVSTPTLAAVDNASTSTGVVATITGADATATVTLGYQKVDAGFTGTAWTTGGNRTGNGTISQSLGTGIYWFRAVSTLATESAVSNLVFGKVSNGLDAVHEQCLDAVYAGIQTLIAAGSIPGVSNAARVHNLAELDLKAMDLPGIAVCIALPGQQPAETLVPKSNLRSDFGYPVFVIFLDRFAGDYHKQRGPFLKARQALGDYFIDQKLGTTDAHLVTLEPGPILRVEEGKYHVAGTVLLLRPVIRRARGV